MRTAVQLYTVRAIDATLPELIELVGETALEGVDRWEAAVAATRRLVTHVRHERSPERVGQRTYRELAGGSNETPSIRTGRGDRDRRTDARVGLGSGCA